MKYFNKEDIEIKNSDKIIEKKFGDITGFFSDLPEITYSQVKNLNINNMDIQFDAYGIYSPYIYPNDSYQSKLEDNIELIKDLFLEIKDPKTNQPICQICYGTSEDSIWKPGSVFVTGSSEPRYFWETNDPEYSDFKNTDISGNDGNYCSVGTNRFSSGLFEKTNFVYKKVSSLLYGDPNSKIKIKNKQEEIVFDDAIFLFFNKNYKCSQVRIIIDYFLKNVVFPESPDYKYKIFYAEGSTYYKVTDIINKFNKMCFNDNNFRERGSSVENINNYLNDLNNRNGNCLYFSKSTTPYQFFLKDLYDVDKNYSNLYSKATLGYLFEDYNLIILRPSTVVYSNNSLINSSIVKICSFMSMFPSTTFINGLYLNDDSDVKHLIDGSTHYNGETFVDIVTSTDADAYFKLLMGFKARLERIYLTEKRKTITAEYVCVAEQNEFNFSSNPTFVDQNKKIVNVIEPAADSEDGQVEQSATTYITKVGLYNEQNQLLAVASLSQPIKKDFNTKRVIKVKIEN